MDILLSHSYFLSEDPVEQKIMKPYPPLGILYNSAYLKQKGFSVEIFDSTFKTKQDFYNLINEKKTSIIGIYCNLLTRLNVIEMTKYCKKHNVIVILGGPEPRYHADKFIENGADIVVNGEGELTLEELIPHLKKYGLKNISNIKGVTYREENGEIVTTLEREFIKDLNVLPLPDRSAIDINQYLSAWKKYHGMGSISLITARGCPYHCKWCSRAVFGESHRRRSPNLVADEVEMLIQTYKPDMLWFADDVFTINHKWTFEFAEEMKKRNLKIPFECISRADRLTDEILKILSEMGCFRIWYGSESGSQKVLDAMSRGVTVQRIREITKLTKKHGIKSGLFVMFGYPDEEIEDIEKTIEHLKISDPDEFLTTVAYPLKGTPFYSEVQDRIIEPAPWEKRIDRKLSIGGRYSDRFYWFVQRRVVNEFRLHKISNATFMSQNGRWKKFIKMIEFFTKSKIAKIGMEITKFVKS